MNARLQPQAFAEGVRKYYPSQMLGFNLSPSLYWGKAKKAGKEAKPATATPPCADPGPFVYPPAAATAAAAAPAAAPAAPAAPAAATKAPAKKT